MIFRLNLDFSTFLTFSLALLHTHVFGMCMQIASFFSCFKIPPIYKCGISSDWKIDPSTLQSLLKKKVVFLFEAMPLWTSSGQFWRLNISSPSRICIFFLPKVGPSSGMMCWWNNQTAALGQRKLTCWPVNVLWPVFSNGYDTVRVYSWSFSTWFAYFLISSFKSVSFVTQPSDVPLITFLLSCCSSPQSVFISPAIRPLSTHLLFFVSFIIFSVHQPLLLCHFLHFLSKIILFSSFWVTAGPSSFSRDPFVLTLKQDIVQFGSNHFCPIFSSLSTISRYTKVVRRFFPHSTNFIHQSVLLFSCFCSSPCDFSSIRWFFSFFFSFCSKSRLGKIFTPATTISTRTIERIRRFALLFPLRPSKFRWASRVEVERNPDNWSERMDTSHEWPQWEAWGNFSLPVWQRNSINLPIDSLAPFLHPTLDNDSLGRLFN